ncbi:15-hydroxyprostaglandin dehydrogenase [NAD(+)] [Bicyclus anynana]|uniref:15-hydroxyprostaglandin dehydrogenase [NAD(+)] n=1 Tax=Bicyclus anynana TaxID=110368 RepID=A0A6J1N9J8_BICAN|nr:15-hydroxyprostaglandin dehydrogenase [NAD(+)] [Bicyclus anynana]XP_023943579.2 15-hydroxyprostaglandin dehydrogenase [NAD(+)] [Bicyclus anynana]
MDRDVKGKVAVITGGADGLGLAMVKSFLQKGAKLVISLDINEEQGKASEAALKSEYGNDRVVFYKCNVQTDLEAIFDKIIAEYKAIDILINNAGVLDELNIRRTIEVNTIALMEWTMKFYEQMRTDKGGKGGTIINVSSIYGFRVLPYIPYYHGSKFAVIGFSKSIGHEDNFKKSGVRVVTLCPGLTHTNMANYPKIKEDDMIPEFKTCLLAHDWQDPVDIGRGTVEIFEKADTGTVWLVEGTRPAEKLNF